MQKFLKQFIIITIILSLNLNIVSAETVSTDEQKAQNRDSVTKFIDSLVDMKMWQDNWKDYFKNYCQRTEIFRLRRELNELRTDITDSVFEELNINVDEMVHEYYKANAQLYFIRHFVESIQNPALDKEESAYMITARDKLEKDMYNYFVLEKGYITSSEMGEYIDYFYSRYESSYYANCMDPTLEGVKDKALSIVDKFKNYDFDNLIEDAELDDPIIPNATTLKDSPNTKSFLWNRLGIRIHNVESLWDPAKIFKDILYGDGTVESSSTANEYRSPEEIGITNVVSVSNEDKIRYDFDIEITKRLTKYEVKYKEVNDAALNRYTSLLEELNSTLTNSINPMNKVTECLDNTLNKQCSQ